MATAGTADFAGPYDRAMGSDANGRSLEFEIVRVLLDRGAGAAGNTLADQARDAPKFAKCAAAVRNRHSAVAPQVADWIEGRVGSFRHLRVERMGDSAGGVADLRMLRDGSPVLSVSIKFNHDALKHPRPYSLAQACGFDKGSPADEEHRASLGAIAERFVAAARRFDCATFSEIPKRTHAMYDEVVDACAASLRRWLGSAGDGVGTALFDFLVPRGFHKVIVPRDPAGRVIVEDFTGIAVPTALQVRADGSYLDLRFDNSWHIRMRLHSAAKEINLDGGQLSLKFDARKESGEVPSRPIAPGSGR